MMRPAAAAVDVRMGHGVLMCVRVRACVRVFVRVFVLMCVRKRV